MHDRQQLTCEAAKLNS